MSNAAPYLPPAFTDHPNRADMVLALSAADRVGSALRDFWLQSENLHTREKRAGDFVSAADLQAEWALRASLCAEGDGWMGEETPAARGVGDRCWIVDPLDGTTNFLRGIGHWAISIALEIEGKRVLALVQDPLRKESFYALRGAGAYLNGVPLQGAETTRMQQALRHRHPFWWNAAYRGACRRDRPADATLCRRPPNGGGGARSRLRGLRSARRFLGTAIAGLGRRGRAVESCARPD